MNGADIWQCAMQAIGVGALIDAFNIVESGNKAILKKLAKKTFLKIAGKFLGPIGVAIALADFGICLYNQ